MKHCLLVLFLLFSINTFAQGSLEGDRLALVALYNSAGGSGWYNNTGWVVPGSSGDNPCGWAGVTCNNGRITKLNLPENDFIGSIPPEIGNLTALTYLDLSGAGREFVNLSGNIPAELGNLSILEHLNLIGNNFNSDNIKEIGNLVNLKYLAITPDWNIPDEFGNLINLEYLNLSVLDQSGLGSEGQAGNIPTSFGNLTKLETFIMNDAGATGSIPAELGNLINLETLDFRRNQLVGNIPGQLKNLTALTILDLSDNKLSGIIPNLSGIPVSASVNISNNQFTFDGLETNINLIDIYSPQSIIPLVVSPAFPLPYTISVDAGGIETNYHDNNTYKIFKDNILINTQVGYNWLFIMGGGKFRIEVTNSIATNLTLYSQEIFIPLETMPVTLVSFKGEGEKNENLLTWQTTSETNNSGFEIGKSADAKTFEKIGYVDGGGDSKDLKIYSYSDTNPLTVTYYRLKQIDYDGKFEYSRIIKVKQDHSDVSIYPNPAGNELFVKDLEKEERMIIKNVLGKVILNQKVVANQQVNTSSFPNGLYIITIGNETKKLVIQK